MQFIINKSQNGNLTPSQFNLVINEAQYEYLTFLLGNLQQYQYGRPIPRIDYSQNQTARQKLTPTIYNIDLTIDVDGHSDYPTYFISVDSMINNDTKKRIRWAGQERLWSTYNSVIDKVEEEPIYLLENDGFQFYPTDLGEARLSYVKMPPNITWGYTNDGNSRPVYNPATSTDPIWGVTEIMQIVVRALKMVGVNLQDGAVSQFAEQLKQQGD